MFSTPEILLFFYFLLIFFIFLKTKKRNIQKNSEKPEISVIIAFHNEEKNIESLFSALAKQDYPREKIEFIFVDDRSKDKTNQLLKSNNFNAQIIDITELPDGKFGKKNALDHAIKKAKNDILLFTDADCTPHENWIKETVSAHSKKTAAVVGSAPLFPKKNNIIGFFQSGETLFNHVIAKFGISLGSAFTSFGRNFSYKKSKFLEVGGFKNIEKSLSGDDDLLLHEFIKNGDEVVFADFSIVDSHTEFVFSTFFRQKTRHMSATKFFPFKLQVFSVFFHALHLFVTINYFFTESVFVFVGSKIFIDFLLFQNFSKLLPIKKRILSIIAWEIFYIPFILFFSVFSYTKPIKKLKWK
jgi:cellulose synthase/poly-beta-1,6-N-acetylglucosamine synthase-like glycosyltransferase